MNNNFRNLKLFTFSIYSLVTGLGGGGQSCGPMIGEEVGEEVDIDGEIVVTVGELLKVGD
jgi:hypothetical protein